MPILFYIGNVIEINISVESHEWIDGLSFHKSDISINFKVIMKAQQELCPSNLDSLLKYYQVLQHAIYFLGLYLSKEMLVEKGLSYTKTFMIKMC